MSNIATIHVMEKEVCNSTSKSNLTLHMLNEKTFLKPPHLYLISLP